MFRKITLIIGLFLLLGIPLFLYTQVIKDSPSVLGSDTEMEAVQIGVSPS